MINNSQRYCITFTIPKAPEKGSIDASMDGVSGLEDALQKLNEIIDAKKAVLQSISEITDAPSEDHAYFLFTKGDFSTNQSVGIYAKNLNEATAKYKEISGFNDLKLRQVTMKNSEKGNASFELTKETINEDGSEDYLTMSIYTKDLSSAFKKAEELTGIKDLSLKSVYKFIE